jgi:hypothetical protein
MPHSEGLVRDYASGRNCGNDLQAANHERLGVGKKPVMRHRLANGVHECNIVLPLNNYHDREDVSALSNTKPSDPTLFF